MKAVQSSSGAGMVLRMALYSAVLTVCAVVAPRNRNSDVVATTFDPTAQISEGALPSQSEYAELARTNPVAMMEASLRRYKAEVKGFRATMLKQERVGDTLHPPEVVKVSVREQPFAVQMIWTAGVRDSNEGSVYASGENHGLVTVWRPSAFLKKIPINPNDSLPRKASRYSITDSSFAHSMYRTYEKWKQAQAEGRLQWTFEGEREVPECGNRKCFVLSRVCVPKEVDNFSLDERDVKDPAKFPQQALSNVTLYYDCETWIQVGAILKRADGQLIGSYIFRDVELNPHFTPGIFSPDGFKK